MRMRSWFNNVPRLAEVNRSEWVNGLILENERLKHEIKQKKSQGSSKDEGIVEVIKVEPNE